MAAAAATEKKFKERLKKFSGLNPQKASQKRWKAMVKLIGASFLATLFTTKLNYYSTSLPRCH